MDVQKKLEKHFSKIEQSVNYIRSTYNKVCWNNLNNLNVKVTLMLNPYSNIWKIVLENKAAWINLEFYFKDQNVKSVIEKYKTVSTQWAVEDFDKHKTAIQNYLNS